jgi:hypothetical protein
MKTFLFADQSEIRLRPPPPVPYERTTEILEISQMVLECMAKLFLPYAKRKLESCCFWYGVRNGERSRVFAIAVPKQNNTWGNYHVSGDAMSQVSSLTRPHGWQNLSQVHTHPGVDVEHSLYDDQFANSRRALSVVVPHYGRWDEKWPNGMGVHEYQNGHWHLLTPELARLRVAVIADYGPIKVVDVRR